MVRINKTFWRQAAERRGRTPYRPRIDDGNAGSHKRRFAAGRHAEAASGGHRRALDIGHAERMATAAGTDNDFRRGLRGGEIEGDEALGAVLVWARTAAILAAPVPAGSRRYDPN